MFERDLDALDAALQLVEEDGGDGTVLDDVGLLLLQVRLVTVDAAVRTAAQGGAFRRPALGRSCRPILIGYFMTFIHSRNLHLPTEGSCEASSC